jgi:TraX protein
MTTFQIKLIAVTSMVIDHVGLCFFPHVLLFRIVGRLAFPLFAWLIANGAYYSKNLKIYLIRLFIFALVAQIPSILMNRLVIPSFWQLNVLFTLFLGLTTIILTKKSKNTLISLLIVIIIAGIAGVSNTDYGAMGVVAMVAFYISFKDVKKMIILQICVFSLFNIIPISIIIALHGASSPIIPVTSFILCGIDCFNTSLKLHSTLPIMLIGLNFIESLGLLSLFFIALYNNQGGIKAKYFFYAFYPIHMLVLYFIKLFV